MHSSTKFFCLWAMLCGFFAIVILSPLGSPLGMYPNFPDNDYIEYAAMIVQAKMAINEGQFPIRVLPLDHQGLGYPLYQFYGPFVFTISGYLYKFLTYISVVTHAGGYIFSDPLNTMKWILLLTITLGGIYAYRFAKLFTESDLTAMLAATTYLFAPYFILMVNFLGDYPEAFSTSLLPIALFYTTKNMIAEKFNLVDFLFSSAIWFIVLTSHLVTFAYASLFFGLMSLVFLIIHFCTLRGFICSVLSIGFAYFLAAWFIIPILLLSSHLHISHWWIQTNAIKTTTLGNLLALNSEGLSRGIPFFYASIGWPCLFGFLSNIFFLMHPKKYKAKIRYKLALGMSMIFFVALIIAWSPFNVLKFFPHYFAVGQFGHRLIIQIMWIGIIPFILAIENIFGLELEAKHFVIGVFLICMVATSWLQVPKDGVSVATLLKTPELLYAGGGGFDYIYKTQGMPAANKLRPISPDGMLPLKKSRTFCMRKNAKVQCQLNIDKTNPMAQLPALYYPGLLNISLDGKSVPYEATPFYIHNGATSIYERGWVSLPIVTITLPPGNHDIVVRFTGIHWANVLAIASWLLFFSLSLYALMLHTCRKFIISP